MTLDRIYIYKSIIITLRIHNYNFFALFKDLKLGFYGFTVYQWILTKFKNYINLFEFVQNITIQIYNIKINFDLSFDKLINLYFI